MKKLHNDQNYIKLRETLFNLKVKQDLLKLDNIEEALKLEKEILIVKKDLANLMMQSKTTETLVGGRNK